MLKWKKGSNCWNLINCWRDFTTLLALLLLSNYIVRRRYRYTCQRLPQHSLKGRSEKCTLYFHCSAHTHACAYVRGTAGACRHAHTYACELLQWVPRNCVGEGNIGAFPFIDFLGSVFLIILGSDVAAVSSLSSSVGAEGSPQKGVWSSLFEFT